MCYAENGTAKFLETLADNVFTHELWESLGVTQAYTLKYTASHNINVNIHKYLSV